jgi:hypothetical protein
VRQEKAAGTQGVRGELVWPRWDWAPSRGSNACACKHHHHHVCKFVCNPTP